MKTVAAAAALLFLGMTGASAQSTTTAPGSAPGTPPPAATTPGTAPGTDATVTTTSPAPGTTSINPQAPPPATVGRGTGDANPGPTNRAVNQPGVDNPGAPVAGANSFTEGQARSRLESRGFTNVSNLVKDDNGIWRGTAMRDGKSVSVSLDFQGNVVAN